MPPKGRPAGSKNKKKIPATHVDPNAAVGLPGDDVPINRTLVEASQTKKLSEFTEIEQPAAAAGSASPPGIKSEDPVKDEGEEDEEEEEEEEEEEVDDTKDDNADDKKTEEKKVDTQEKIQKIIKPEEKDKGGHIPKNILSSNVHMFDHYNIRLHNNQICSHMFSSVSLPSQVRIGENIISQTLKFF
jgi:cobalamin biosynthesis protein CobT